MNQPKNKPLTDKQRRLRTNTETLFSEAGFCADAQIGRMEVRVEWLAIEPTTQAPPVEDIAELFRRRDSRPDALVVLRATQPNVAIVEWNAFNQLLRDSKELGAIKKAATPRKQFPADFLNGVTPSERTDGNTSTANE